MSTSPSFNGQTTYFLHEGKENLRECLKLSFDAAVAHAITKLVIFTGVGEGVKIAIQEFLPLPEYKDISIVAVGFPAGRIPDSVPARDLELFRDSNVPFVRSHLPFDPMHGTFHERGTGQGLSLLGSALETFCGSMSLCVQAVLVACDAAEIEEGEHVIALTSDTSILVRACPTCDFLTDFVVREILCKPAILTISKKEEKQMTEGEIRAIDSPEIAASPKELTSGQ